MPLNKETKPNQTIFTFPSYYNSVRLTGLTHYLDNPYEKLLLPSMHLDLLSSP